MPFRRYYGSVDSTPLFVMLAGAYLDRTGDLDDDRASSGRTSRRRSRWIDDYGDRDGDGFVEYGRADRARAWPTRAGRTATIRSSMPTAAWPRARSRWCEVQAYVYAAWLAAARRSPRRSASATAATSLRAQGRDACARRFDEAFFDEELGTYVLALDGDKQPCRVRASNAGHALFTGIALPERAGAVVATA